MKRENVLINTAKETAIVASGFSAQLYVWLEHANLVLSFLIGLATFVYSFMRLYDYIKARRNKDV
jgi:hypothetical protein